jgi:uroporphyrinogen decarboxylase
MLELIQEAGGDVIGVDWRIDLTAPGAAGRWRRVQGNLDPIALLALEALKQRAQIVLDQAGGGPVTSLTRTRHSPADAG